MPLICKDMVDLLDNSNSSALNHSSLANYAFLYGVFPTAPSVGIYAVYYNTELQVVRLYTHTLHVTLCILVLAASVSSGSRCQHVTSKGNWK